MAPQRQIISIVNSAGFSELTHLLHSGALDISRSIAEVPSASNLELWMLESRMRPGWVRTPTCAQRNGLHEIGSMVTRITPTMNRIGRSSNDQVIMIKLDDLKFQGLGMHARAGHS
jgi:hypothetical protein